MKTYDLAFSIGSACRTSMSLRDANMQFASFPFDWITGSTFEKRIDDLIGGFAGWMVADNFVHLPTPSTSTNAYYRDKILDYTYVHDFPASMPFEQVLPIVREKYARRAKRLINSIANSRRVFVFWVGRPDERVADGIVALKLAKDKLSKRWPSTKFEIVAIDNLPGVTLENAKVESEDGVTLILADVRDHNPNWSADEVLLAKWLRENYEVIDYRSEAERKAWQIREQQKELERYKGKNVFDRIVAKYEYKLYKHFLKRMSKRGMI